MQAGRTLVSGSTLLIGAGLALSAVAFRACKKAIDQMENGLLHAPDQAHLTASGAASTLQQGNLTDIERIRAETLVQASAYHTASPAPLQQPMARLVQSTTVAEAKAAQQLVMETLAGVHRQSFAGQLVEACRFASAEAGFETITAAEQRGDRWRVVAENQAGHALVTEIKVPNTGTPTMATEIIGLHDGTCQTLLDRYDQALERRGVRGVKPVRMFTGGVCETAAARTFAKHWKKRVRAQKARVKPAASKRTRRRKRNQTLHRK